MADFLSYGYGISTGSFMYDDFTRYYAGMGATGSNSAYNPYNKVSYYTSKARETRTKDWMYTSGVSGSPMFIDANDSIWTFTGYTVRKYSLLGVLEATYNITASGVAFAAACMTHDGLYVYVVNDNAKIVKYSVAALAAGETYEWAVQTSNFAHAIFVDSENNVYVQHGTTAGIGVPGNLVKYSKSDGSLVWSIATQLEEGQGFYSLRNDSIYTPFPSSNTWREYDTDGTQTGETESPSAGTVLAIGCNAFETEFFGTTDNSQIHRLTAELWSDAEVIIGSGSNPNNEVQFVGDSTGYLSSVIRKKVLNPEVDVFPGNYSTPFYIVMTCKTYDSYITYTTNGIEPVSGDTRFSVPFKIDRYTVVKARAFKDGWTASDVMTWQYGDPKLFEIVFWHEDEGDLVCIDRDMHQLWRVTATCGYYPNICVDTRNNFFCVHNGSNYIEARSLFDGSVLYTSDDTYTYPYLNFIDYYGRLWVTHAWEDDLGQQITVFDTDMSVYATYTLKSGNALGDHVFRVALTRDMSYVYVVGGDLGDAELNLISKYDIDELDGGDPEWTVELDTSYWIQTVLVDEDDDVYIDSYYDWSESQITKLFADTGDILWNTQWAYDEGYYPYPSYKEGYIYCCDYYNYRFKQLNSTTGVEVANSGAYTYSLAYDTAVSRFDGLVSCLVNSNKIEDVYVDKYVNDGWTTGQEEVESFHRDGNVYYRTDHYWRNSDPTGYINSQFYVEGMSSLKAYCFRCGRLVYQNDITQEDHDSANRRNHNLCTKCGGELTQRKYPNQQLEKYSHANRNRR